MQKTSAQANDCPQRDRTESEWYEGVQTFMWICEDNIVEVPFDKEHLLERILSPCNLNQAYKALMKNKGCGGIDEMSCGQLLPWLRVHRNTLISSLLNGTYHQALTPLYERQFSKSSYGFRPRKGCHDALRGAQKTIGQGYK